MVTKMVTTDPSPLVVGPKVKVKEVMVELDDVGAEVEPDDVGVVDDVGTDEELVVPDVIVVETDEVDVEEEVDVLDMEDEVVETD